MKNLCPLKFKIWSTFHLFLNTQHLPPSRGTGLNYAPSPSKDLPLTRTEVCRIKPQIPDWEKQSLHYTLTACHYVIKGLSQSIPLLPHFNLHHISFCFYGITSVKAIMWTECESVWQELEPDRSHFGEKMFKEHFLFSFLAQVQRSSIRCLIIKTTTQTISRTTNVWTFFVK